MALHDFNYEREATVSIVKIILTDAIKMKASDIHFDPEPNKLVIRFRINGDLIEYTTSPESVKTNILTRIKILSGMNITEATIPQIGSINFELNSKIHNMRAATIPVIDGEKIVVHLSNYAKNFKNLNSLGFTKENIDKILSMLENPDGIILITGVNSSGKTTSMYAILQELSKKPINIISVENPIKMKLPGINQVQINNEKGITYNSILRTILLSDPDVIAINELIDDETVRTALRSSISGRLVLSTMNTKTAFTTIKSLLNMDVENYLLGSNLNGIISQRLVKKLCPTCRKKRPTSLYEKRIIKEILDEDIDEIYTPIGCEECQDGYIDQIPVSEVVTINDELRQAISNHRNEDLIYNIIYSENDPIIKDIFKKVTNGDTSFEEAIKIIDIKTDLNKDENNLKDLLLGKKGLEDDVEKSPQDEVEENIDTDNQDVEENKNIKTKKTDKKKKADKKNKNENNDLDPNEQDNDSENDNDSTSEEENKAEDNSNNGLINDSELLEQALKLIKKQLKKKKEKENKEQEESSNDETSNDKDIDEETTDNDTNDEISEEENYDESNDDENTDDENFDESNEENIEEDISDDKEIEEQNDNDNKKETTSAKEKPAPPSHIIIPQDNDSDDDDDDDFNYDNSYINNF